MDQFNDFPSMYTYLFGLYQQGQYAEALAIAERESERFSQNKALMYHFRACMSGRLNDKTGALAILNEAIDSGFWYPDYYWFDDDLAVLRDDPDLERLRMISVRRYIEAQKTSKPDLTVITPSNQGSLPLVIALHGNDGNIEQTTPLWTPAIPEGWLLAVAQSSQIVGSGSFVWDDVAVADKELTDHYQTLCAQYAHDAERLVIGGFSMGGETAIRVSLQGLLPVRGFIAVTPGGPLTRNPESWKPMIEVAKGKKNLRGAIIVAGRDNAAQETRQLVQMLNDAGIECKLLDYPDMGHTFPPDFAERLPELLAFITAD